MPKKMVAPGQVCCSTIAPMKMPKTAEQHHATKKRATRKRRVSVCKRSFTSTHGEVALVPLERKTLETAYSHFNAVNVFEV